MAELTITDPDLHAEKNVDGDGRVYIGREFAGDSVTITVERHDDE